MGFVLLFILTSNIDLLGGIKIEEVVIKTTSPTCAMNMAQNAFFFAYFSPFLN